MDRPRVSGPVRSASRWPRPRRVHRHRSRRRSRTSKEVDLDDEAGAQVAATDLDLRAAPPPDREGELAPRHRVANVSAEHHPDTLRLRGPVPTLSLEVDRVCPGGGRRSEPVDRPGSESRSFGHSSRRRVIPPPEGRLPRMPVSGRLHWNILTSLATQICSSPDEGDQPRTVLREVQIRVSKTVDHRVLLAQKSVDEPNQDQKEASSGAHPVAEHQATADERRE